MHNLYDKLFRSHMNASGQTLYVPGTGYMLGWGTTVGNGVETWAKGALFLDNDASAGAQFWINTGTSATATWKAITSLDAANTWAAIQTFTLGISTNDAPIYDSSTNELIAFTKVSSAVNEVNISNNSTGLGPILKATGETNVPITLAGKGTGAVNLGQTSSTGVVLLADQPINDSAGNELIKFVKTASAVNEITVTNNSTGAGPIISATGETNVDLTVLAKGTGSIIMGASGSFVKEIAGFSRCTTDISYNSNTTLSTPTGMTAATLQAGKIYRVKGHLFTISTANSGLKCALTAASLTATSFIGGAVFRNNGTAGTGATVTALGALHGVTAEVVTDVEIDGLLVVNAAGTLALQTAANASHADTTTVKAGSWIQFTEVA